MEQIIKKIREAQKLMSFGYWDAAHDLLDEVIGENTLAQPKHEWLRGECVKCGQSIEQSEQEPVGRFSKFTDGIWREVTDGSAGQLLYTTPLQRTWVGLTLEDKNEFLAQDFGGNRLDAMDWAEKRLKEKNT